MLARDYGATYALWRTSPDLHRFGVVLRYVRLDPFPVFAPGSHCLRILVQPPGDDPVSDETRQ